MPSSAAGSSNLLDKQDIKIHCFAFANANPDVSTSMRALLIAYLKRIDAGNTGFWWKFLD